MEYGSPTEKNFKEMIQFWSASIISCPENSKLSWLKTNPSLKDSKKFDKSWVEKRIMDTIGSQLH